MDNASQFTEIQQQQKVSETYRWSAGGPPQERIVSSASPSASRNGRRQQGIDASQGTHSEKNERSIPDVSVDGVTQQLCTLYVPRIELDDECTRFVLR